MRQRSGSVSGASRGKITVICGSMFSGKTEELIRLVRRAMHAKKAVQVFKSSLETRCDTTLISTHDGANFGATAVANTAAIEAMLKPDIQVVGIEEVQFFDPPIVELCQRLADRGVHVIVAGLDQDFRGLPFTFMPQLLALSDDVVKLHAICKVCGEEASRTQRLVNGRPASWNEPTILIGADESYEARCRKCHRVTHAPRGQGRYQEPKRMRSARPSGRIGSRGKPGPEPQAEITHVAVTPRDDAEPDTDQLRMFKE